MDFYKIVKLIVYLFLIKDWLRGQLMADFQELNAEGFIPGRDETEEAFFERVDYCRNLKNNFEQVTGLSQFSDINFHQSDKYLHDDHALYERLYGIKPCWVPLIFSTNQLAPWHGGCAWIFQIDKNSPTSAFLQLRVHFRDRSTFLKIYSRNELIVHELAHVGRMLYHEPHFEEILAYQSSSSPFRKWLGPIFSSSKESLIIVFLLILAVASDISILFLGRMMEEFARWIKLLPILYISWILARLYLRQHTFKKCKHNLEKIYSEVDARHLLYRLLDSEINAFSRMRPVDIKKFIEKTSLNSFRWHFLKSIYPT